MSRVRALSLSRLLNAIQASVDVPTVNPRRLPVDRLWEDVPREVSRRGQLGYFVASFVILVVIGVTWALTALGHPTFIYEQF